MNIWLANSISNTQVTNATIQQPAVKKIKMNPDNNISETKNTTPIRNQIKDDERIILSSSN